MSNLENLRESVIEQAHEKRAYEIIGFQKED